MGDILQLRKSDRANGDSNLYFLVTANRMTDARTFPRVLLRKLRNEVTVN